ncbi:glycoside hydrolase family 73 protein [Lactobacillus taiwanensis]|uniref:glycoside hydrolase family 73 protein n=1 Tax=Lactobacillus taiwanensis TaxID=508451 RepID=UPI000B981287
MHNKENFIYVVALCAQRADKPYGLFPSVTISQAVLESNFGQSDLSKKYNNLCGVKGTDPNTSKELTTSEFVNDHWVTVTGRFRVYESYDESIQAHTRLYVNGTSWNSNHYPHVLVAQDYATTAQDLETDTYAQDPR